MRCKCVRRRQAVGEPRQSHKFSDCMQDVKKKDWCNYLAKWGESTECRERERTADRRKWTRISVCGPSDLRESAWICGFHTSAAQAVTPGHCNPLKCYGLARVFCGEKMNTQPLSLPVSRLRSARLMCVNFAKPIETKWHHPSLRQYSCQQIFLPDYLRGAVNVCKYRNILG